MTTQKPSSSGGFLSALFGGGKAKGGIPLSPPARVKDYYKRGWWTGRTVDNVFREAVAESGDDPAIVDPLNRADLLGSEPQRWSFGELNGRVNALCEWFATQGLKRGDRVVMQLPNIVEGVAVFLACARSGLILSPVAVQYRKHELAQILPLIEPKAFLTVTSFAGHPYAEGALAACAAHAPDAVVACWGDNAPDGAVSLDSLGTSSTDAAPLGGKDIDPNEVLTICWTSGTESAPKGVPRHHNHWVFNGEIMLEAATVKKGEAFLSPFPMINIASIGGMVMPWLIAKGVLVQHHPFDLGVFLRQIAQEKVVYTLVPPAVLNQLLKAPEILEKADISSVRRVASGSAPLAPWMVKGWQEEHGVTVINVFGSNEGASLVTTGEIAPDPETRAAYFPRFGDSDVWPSRVGTSVRTRLVDPETEKDIKKPGEKGELRIDGAMTFDGYWRKDGIDTSCFDKKGYFRTGDLFELVDDKFYRFVGRSKEIIIRGGVNISPAEVEALVESHPAVREAACASYPDERLGERVCAVVALHEGQSLTLEELTAFLKEKELAVYKLPEKLKTVDALPRNSLGKVVRRELNEAP